MAYTNMKTLLADLKTLGKSYANGTKGTSLNYIKTWKIGVIPPKAVYPMVAFVPRYETYGGYRNGGIYRVNRYVDIEVYSLNTTMINTGTIQSICTNTLEMFYDVAQPNNYKMLNDVSEPTVFHFEPGRIEYGNQMIEDQRIQRATIPMIFSSWEATPTTTVGTAVNDTSVKSIGEFIYETLKAETNLKSSKMLYSHNYPPFTIGEGNVISVLENVDERNRRETGRDNPTGYIDIFVWSKLSPHESYLDLNMDVVENIKDALQAIPTLGNRAYRSHFERVDYGVNMQALLYVSRLKFMTYSYNTLPQYA
jgi:hypothetical protein